MSANVPSMAVEEIAKEIESLPEAGSLSGASLQKIMAMVGRLKVATVAEAVRGLGAMTFVADGTGGMMEVADAKSRLVAVALLWDRMEGKAATTNFNLNAEVGGQVGAAELLAGLPEAAATLRAMADSIDSGGRMMKQVASLPEVREELPPGLGVSAEPVRAVRVRQEPDESDEMI